MTVRCVCSWEHSGPKHTSDLRCRADRVPAEATNRLHPKMRRELAWSATVLRTLHTDQQHPFCQSAKEVRIQSMDQPLLNPLSTQGFGALNLAWLHRTMRAIRELIDQR